MSSSRSDISTTAQRSVSRKILNKNFYRFLFSFIAVIAGVLMFILVLGVGGGVQ